MPETIAITLNGERTELSRSMTVLELLEHLEIRAARVAVERNRQVVKRADHETTRVQDGDVIEVIHFVGGG